MVAYLAMQPLAVLSKLATAYIHNSDVMARNDAKKRKADKASTATGASAGIDKPDKQHTTTVMMMACIIQALPYDLPSFLPALITSFVRHVGVPSLKDTVTRTVQMFKRTHQVYLLTLTQSYILSKTQTNVLTFILASYHNSSLLSTVQYYFNPLLYNALPSPNLSI